MYYSQISHLVNHPKVFEIGSRLLEFFALNIRSAVYEKTNDNETLNCFLKSITKTSTVLDVGRHEKEYLLFIVKMAKRSGRLIVFECEQDTYDYLCEKKEVLKLKNVDIEKLELPDMANKPARVVLEKQARVIDFSTPIRRESKVNTPAATLDSYCLTNNIKPDFIKISSESGEVAILNGATNILQKDKPRILVECKKVLGSSDKIFQTFKFLTELKYSGYFILDTIKIPVSNFDPNIYQNPFTNFYCKEFIFD